MPDRYTPAPMSSVCDAKVSPEQIATIKSRLVALRSGLAHRGQSAILITGDQDVRFLAGCFGHDTRILVLPTRAILISDRRYEEYLAPWQECGCFDVAIHGRPEQSKFLCEALAGAGLTQLGIQASHVTLDAKDALSKALKGIELVPVNGLLSELRMCKSAAEVSTIERAIGIQVEALAATLATIRLGMTEGQLAARLIYEMRIRGAECESFEPIVGSGPNASVIHHTPGDYPIGPGVLLIDWGARVDGLCSDLTRTFFLGEPDDEMKRVYTVVAEAHLAAIDACQVGTSTADVDAAAREVITAAGWGEQFAHSVGHGLGRDVHEQPFMGKTGDKVKLAAGMVVTIEPGIYLPGIGGVRIEDDILVTVDGPRVLSEELDSTLSAAILPLPQEGAM